MGYSKAIINGNQICDYLYIQANAPEENSFLSVNDEPLGWDKDTILYANFNNKDKPLNAGDSELIGSIEGYEVHRKKTTDSHSEYIGTISSHIDFMIDYAARNHTDYVYYLYPNVNQTSGGVLLPPVITPKVFMDCPYWSLFIVDESDEENVFYLDKMFKFELNLEVGDMNNNSQVTISQNFTRYPHVQFGSSNYWSGSLKSLCGYMSTNCTDYIQTVDMINELKEISSDNRRKFLKDIEGNIWEVDISAPINISSENMCVDEIKSWSFSWVEVGDANGISIINNPNKPISDWVVNKDGKFSLLNANDIEGVI